MLCLQRCVPACKSVFRVGMEKLLGLISNGLNKQSAGSNDVSKAAGRLALLTALASYQVDEGIVLVFRVHFPEDDKLLGTLAWASFTAARRIGSWLLVPK